MAILNLIREEDTIYGNLFVENFYIEIFDLGQHILFLELDKEFICENPLSGYEGMSETQSLSFQSLENGCDNCEIDVLVVYEPQTKNRIEKIKGISMNFIMNSMEVFFNETERRSSHNNSYAQIRIIHHQTVLVNNNVLTTQDFLFKLAQNNNIQNIRSQYKADLVHFFAWDPSWEGFEVGRGFTGYDQNQVVNGDPALNAYAYAYSDMKYFTFRTPTHEIGHNLGANHDDWPTPYACKGKVMDTRKNCLQAHNPVGTIMATSTVRINQFSNPYIKYEKQLTGDFGSRFNHYFVDLNKCTVSNYRNPLPSSTVYISGPTYGCPSTAVQLEACLYSSQTPSGYNWFISTNGLNWTLAGNTPTINIQLSNLPGLITFVRLEVIYSFAPTEIRYHNIQTSGSINGLPCGLKIGNTKSSSLLPISLNKSQLNNEISRFSEKQVWIQSNPVIDNTLELNFSKQFNNQNVKLIVSDIQGRILIEKMKINIINNTYLLELNEKFSNGVYFVQLITNNESFCINFIK